MSFNLEKFFKDIFAPQNGDTVTICTDLPHGHLSDNKEWQERRQMAKEWRDKIAAFSDKWQIKVNPLVSYLATGSTNSDLPPKAMIGDVETDFESLIKGTTIIIVMSEYSATAPIKGFAKKYSHLRGATMPHAARFMEKTSLSADYSTIQDRCRRMAPIFKEAVGAEATFSTGHKCYFDISLNNPVHRSDAYLHLEVAGTIAAVCNLPTGEVYVVPNENDNSKTEGELPEKLGDEIAVYVVKHNKIVDVKGKSDQAKKQREAFQNDPARSNIAEFAIGCNDKAKVCGNILEDEKAGFHWAYGRSEHFGGKVGPKNFIAPSSVIHQDVVYAKDCPIQCSQLDFIFPDGSRKTLIINGELKI